MAISQAQRERIKEQLKNRRKTRAFKIPKFPTMEEMEYGNAIIKEVKKIDDLVKEFLLPDLDRLLSHKEERFDKTSLFFWLTGIPLINAIISRIKSAYYGESIEPESEPRQVVFTRSIKRMVSPYLERVKRKTEKQFVDEFQRQTGVEPTANILDVNEFIEDSLSKNVALIKTIPQRHFAEIERVVKEAVTKGELSRSVKDKLLEISDASKNRARLIARDQVGKLVANIEEARQRKAGVSKYIWRTMRDSRVRSFANSNGYSDHKRLEGQIIEWSDPPVTVFKGNRAGERHHAGTDIQDRCFPQPIYDEITGIPHPDTIEAMKKAS